MLFEIRAFPQRFFNVDRVIDYRAARVFFVIMLPDPRPAQGLHRFPGRGVVFVRVHEHFADPVPGADCQGQIQIDDAVGDRRVLSTVPYQHALPDQKTAARSVCHPVMKWPVSMDKTD